MPYFHRQYLCDHFILLDGNIRSLLGARVFAVAILALPLNASKFFAIGLAVEGISPRHPRRMVPSYSTLRRHCGLYGGPESVFDAASFDNSVHCCSYAKYQKRKASSASKRRASYTESSSKVFFANRDSKALPSRNHQGIRLGASAFPTRC